MATDQVIVSRRVRIDGPLGTEFEGAARAGNVRIELEDGRRVRLAADDEKSLAYARILVGLEQIGGPVYLEVDGETEAIRLLRIPNVGRVTRMHETGEGLEFELDTSHARFRLRRGGRSDAAAGVLREAADGRKLLMLTVDESSEVIDARFFEPGPDDGPFPENPFVPPFPPRPRPLEWLRWPFWPWTWLPRWCISASRAQQVFNAMAATSCAPLTVPAPCIPFLYPDDGCWARAHEMCRLMIAMGVSPRKVWIQGSLRTPTRNNPNCFVRWGWHVAPTVCVGRSVSWWRPWLWFGQTMVIDPSLFTTPMTVAQWKSVQGDANATLTYTDASDYRWGETDPTYSKTNDRLAYYRLQLQTRAVNSGPPPYANCP